jgi:hypothetical protein
MALIGTVSGSNGTSTTAISGSLIIADQPSALFPTLSSGVKLFVSGNKTELGADTPNSIFGGDTFVSGAFGTDSYVQMKPVGTLRIPTNTTASYIYTSGSTNDLYFTQYSGPYTNTTRLRWLEGSLQTGLLHGGVLSTENGTTTFSITSGSGIIVNYNASTTTEPYPTITTVDWPAYVSSSLPNITTDEITYISIDSTGAIFKQNTAYTDGDFEDKIIIGRVLHQNGSVTNGTITSPTVSYGQTGFRGDFIRAFGPLKLSGHVVSVNGTATNPPTNTEFLGLAKTAGDSYVEGRNYTTNPNSPNYIKSTTDTALAVSKIYREYVNSSGVPVIDTGVANAGYTAVDVTNYNNAGTLTAIGAGNKFTIQRLYWFPNSVNRAIFAYYGTAIYTTIEAAEAAIGTEAFTEGDNTRDAAILLGYLIVKEGATNLNDTAQAKLVQAGLSRAVSSTGGGGGATTPGGSDTYVQYNDGGSFNGASQFRFIEGTGTVLAANLVVTGSTAGSLVSSGTFQVKDGSGNIVGSVSTSGIISGSSDLQVGGNVTGSNALLSGDLAVNGGDITSSAATFNFVNTGVTSLNIGSAATSISMGAAGGSLTISSDITGSNLRLTGDIAVVGGDLTSTAATFNLATNLATQLNVGGTTPTISVGTSTGASTTGIATGTNTIAAAIKNVNIGTGTGAAATVNVNIGSSGSLGRTTLNNDVALTTGNLIGAPGSGANIFSLISSGSMIAKLDVNNDATGHRFEVRDYLDAVKFAANEDGNVEIAGNLTITGSAVNTIVTTTFNLLNTTLTGTLNIGGAATSIFLGSSTSTGSFMGDLGVGGRSSFGGVVERFTNSNGSTGTVTFDLVNQGVFYINNPTGNITANFTGVPTTNLRVITPTIILSQSATARIVSVVQVDGASQTINWANNVIPTGTANKQDVFGFSLIRSGSAWKVLGQMSTYG